MPIPALLTGCHQAPWDSVSQSIHPSCSSIYKYCLRSYYLSSGCWVPTL